MPETNITVSGPTRAAILAALGSDCAVQPPSGTRVEQRVAIELQDQVNDLLGELKAAGFRVRELEESVDQRDGTLLAVAALIGAVPDDTLPGTVASVLEGYKKNWDRLQAACDEIALLLRLEDWKDSELHSLVAAELERRAQRITMLEADVRRLGAQLLDGKAPAAEFKPGDLVTCTWPDGETKAPGIIQGDDPETGRFLVKYYDMPPSGTSGETWAAPEQLAHRSGNEPGDPPAEKPKRGTRKRKADESEQAPPVDRDHYNAWKAEQEAAGITEGLDEMEFKRLKDAGVLAPYIKPLPAGVTPESAAVTPDGKWANDLDPSKGERRPAPPSPDKAESVSKVQAKVPYPNPAAPAAVQAATKARFEFEALPAPVLQAGAKVACWVNGAIAVGHFDRLNDLGWDAPTLSVKMLNGNLIDVTRGEIRGVEAEEPPRQMAGVGAGADDDADDEFGGDW